MNSLVISGHILTPAGFINGDVNIVSGKITAIRGEPTAERDVRDSTRSIILPGFIDLHVHGGAGHDIMEGGEAARHIAAIHARHGTTSLLATTMTAPVEDLLVAFQAMAEICRAPIGGDKTGGARILGVHLEGPFINAAMLGAQPAFARPLDMAEIRHLNSLVPIRVISLAPEVPGNLQLIPGLVAAGFIVQLGHTTGTYEEGAAAIANGARGFTHLFNAMTGMHHRKPGMVGAALAHAEYAEIIPDLLHVHPGAIHVALRAIPKLFCVTDSTAAAGMPDGEYRLGRHTVTKCMGGVRLADGTLAGSSLTMDQALANLVNLLGLTLTDASRRVSTNAADYLRLADRGRIAVGAWADVVVLNGDLKLTNVYVEGNEIER